MNETRRLFGRSPDIRITLFFIVFNDATGRICNWPAESVSIVWLNSCFAL